MKKLIVVEAGLSSPSSTNMVAEAISGAVESHVSRRGEGLEVEFVHAKDYSHELATMMTTGVLTPKLAEIQQRISDADALIAATPVFSASYSGLFKMFFDAMGTDALNGMPMIIAATAGTPRHSLALDFAMRPLFTYLRAKVMTTGVFAATDDLGGLKQEPGADNDGSTLESRINRAASELSREIVNSASAVEGFLPDDNTPRRDSGAKVTSTVTDFASLLRGHDGS
ncbi:MULTISPECIES: FMN reductase [Corynebacterium]|uniref:Oxidoreductase n=1 Tax=Corynebacterium auriscanis TaxID=99807 RepID=A0A0A2DQ98_9CORY|nr:MULTISPECIES: FMN reductase [Corynebacterium]KGM19031.1 oxidoreductase [Corynebacterium auriscanis]MCX2164197.1 FMN reductase [Corynebacterium auriscanis]OFT91820.1 oxidoreductase [Corynebacterium sp. HMSC28B08]WJY72203.1 FMN reductase (NADPH) [Corynebacterium auriscanis]